MNPYAPQSGFTTMLDATKVWPLLWIGSKPPVGHVVGQAGFDVLVLCAEGYQPGTREFLGVTVIRVPFKDDPGGIEASALENVVLAAELVAEHMRHGRRCLVTCMQGRNRSGLVCGMALVQATRGTVTGQRAMALIKDARPFSLSNGAFMSLLSKVCYSE